MFITKSTRSAKTITISFITYIVKTPKNFNFVKNYQFMNCFYNLNYLNLSLNS
jgi:hypothetical protein